MQKSLLRWLFLALGAAWLALLLSSCGEGQPTIRPTEVLTPTPGAAAGPAATPTVSQPITAADGGIASLDDEIVVRIPAGALSADATVTITWAEDEAAGLPPLDGAKKVGPAFDIDLGGATLLDLVMVEAPYDPSTLPPNTPEGMVFLAYFDEAAGQWVPTPREVDTERNVVIAATDHATVFVLYVPVELKAGRLPRSATTVIDSRCEPNRIDFYSFIGTERDFNKALYLSDDQLDPVNLVFCGLSRQQILERLARQGWITAAENSLGPFPCSSSAHYAYMTGGSSVKTSFERYWDENKNCSTQFHVRFFELGGGWIIAGAHHEGLPPHQIDDSWNRARDLVVNAFESAEFEFISLDFGNNEDEGTWRDQEADGRATLPVGVVRLPDFAVYVARVAEPRATTVIFAGLPGGRLLHVAAFDPQHGKVSITINDHYAEWVRTNGLRVADGSLSWNYGPRTETAAHIGTGREVLCEALSDAQIPLSASQLLPAVSPEVVAELTNIC